jgi:hypothetical protein
MKRNTSFEADRSSVVPEIPSAFYGNQMFITCSQQTPSIFFHAYSLLFVLHLLFYIFLIFHFSFLLLLIHEPG